MQDMHPHYNLVLVVLSCVVSVLGSFTALQFALGIPRAQTPAQRWIAVMAAGTAMGGGAIWAMHFIAMLACHLGVQVAYDGVLTGISAVLAIVACSVGLAMASAGTLRLFNLLSAGVLMGLGVAGMHYLGMAAMLTSAQMAYDGGRVALSVGIAIVASMAALWLAFNLRGRWQMFGSALVMGVAVCGMHYTGMSAMQMSQGDLLPAGFAQGISGDHLAVMVFVVVVAMLLLALGLSVVRQLRRATLPI